MALTANQIVAYACQIAKVPGFVSQGQDFLNLFLEELAQNYDFPAAAYLFQNFTVGPNAGTGPQGTQWYLLQLPANTNPILSNAKYLRTHSVFYSVSGTIFYLTQIPLEDYDRLFQGTGISNYPYWYSVDTTGSPNLATVQMAFYPPPNLSLSVSIRNQYQPNAINFGSTGGSSIPWFPQQDILVDGVACKLFRLTSDMRYENARDNLYGNSAKGIDGSINKYMKMMDDRENYAMTVKLDRRRFRSTVFLKPTKTTGFTWVLTSLACSLALHWILTIVGVLMT